MSDAGYVVRLTHGYGFQPNRARTHSWPIVTVARRVASHRTDRPIDRSFVDSFVDSLARRPALAWMTKRTTTTDSAPANQKKKTNGDDGDDEDVRSFDDPRSVRFVAKDIAKTVAWSGFLTTMSVLVGVVSAFDAAFPSVLFREKKRARKSGIARGWKFKNGIRRPELRARMRAVRDATRARVGPGTGDGDGAFAKRHACVLIHGLAGTPDDLCAMESRLIRDPRVLVHRVTCNAPLNSFDGVHAGATRIVEELKAVVEANPTLTHLTLYGNSLGGVYARYAAALMFDEESGTMLGLKPCTFLTTATPHLGVGPWGYFSVVPGWARRLWSKNLGQSIMELCLRDGDSRESGKPLLVEMAEPDSKFIKALAAFERRCAYANATNDFLVSYETASISPEYVDPAKEREWRSLDAPQIVEEFEHDPDIPREELATKSSSRALWGRHPLDERRQMARGLKTLRWKHVNVAFPGPTPLAHNKICALQRSEMLERLFKEGEFIVDHQAAFLLEPLVARYGEC